MRRGTACYKKATGLGSVFKSRYLSIFRGLATQMDARSGAFAISIPRVNLAPSGSRMESEGDRYKAKLQAASARKAETKTSGSESAVKIFDTAEEVRSRQEALGIVLPELRPSRKTYDSRNTSGQPRLKPLRRAMVLQDCTATELCQFTKQNLRHSESIDRELPAAETLRAPRCRPGHIGTRPDLSVYKRKVDHCLLNHLLLEYITRCLDD